MKTSTRRQSTTWKLTRSFVIFGILPLTLLAVLFLIRYSTSSEQQSVDSLQKMTRTFSNSIGDAIDSVDDTLGIIYDYETEDGRDLTDIIGNDMIEQWQKRIYVDDLLEDMLNRNSDISSIRFVTAGDSYTKFRNSEKELLYYPSICSAEMFPSADSYRSRVITSTVAESTYCTNSKDYVFSIVRNYMNTATVEKAGSIVLGTIYADIDVEKIAKYANTLGLDDYGNVYVCNMETGKFLYCSNAQLYDDPDFSLDRYKTYIVNNSGTDRVGDVQLIYNKINDTDYYVVVEANREILRNRVSGSITIMIVTVILAVILLFFLFFNVSGRISEPARQLKVAMQEVETGNFNVTTDIHSGDEMEYLGEGFNKMLQRLNHYIEQVYEAQICRNEAELNALKLQIQPHFLYNTLDVIRMTALENDDPQTAELLESLSAQMRYVISGEGDVVPLRREIENINDYFAIIKVRYQGRMNLIVNIRTSDMDLMVPKLLLQPLVENAVKHGLREKEGQGHVILDLNRFDTYFEITVMDDGVGIDEKTADHIQEFLDSSEPGVRDKDGHVGIGIKNIHDRIRLDYGPEYGVLFTSYVGMGTVVKVKLPLP